MRVEKGFGVIEGLLILTIAGLIGFVGWYIYHVKNKTDAIYNNASNASAGSSTSQIKSSPSPTSYQECLKAKGSQLLQTYPEQCKTAGGKIFTNPSPTNTPVIPGQGCTPKPGYACPG